MADGPLHDNSTRWMIWLPQTCTLHSLQKQFIVIALMIVCILIISVLKDDNEFSPRFRPTGAQVRSVNHPKMKTNRFWSYPEERCERKHLPGCIVIGVSKGGTAALLNYLNLHPKVKTASYEVNFFNNDENYAKGLPWYKKNMPYNFDDHMTIEKTPGYFHRDYVPERIARMDSSIKLLLTVRDPVERTISEYLQVKEKVNQRGNPYKTFEHLAIQNRTGEVNSHYTSINLSMYYLHMLPWLEQFPLKQIHIISAERLVQNPYVVMKGVEQFLELEPWLSPDLFYFNETRRFHCFWNKLQPHCLSDSKGRTHPPISGHLRNKLEDFFQDWNQQFYKLVQQDFGW